MTTTQQANLRQEAQRMIGSIVTRFVSCELVASLLADKITSSSKGTAIFVNRKLGAEKKILALRAVVKENNSRSGIANDFLKWLRDLDTCRRKRNDIVHSAWTLIPVNVKGSLVFGKLNVANNGKRKVKGVTPYEIAEVSKQLENVFLSGITLLETLLDS